MAYQPKYQFIAILSGLLTMLAFSHLVYGVHAKKQAENLSFIWLFLVITAQSLLVFYGLINNAYGIYLPSAINLTGLIYVLYMKLNFTDNSSPERELKDKNILN